MIYVKTLKPFIDIRNCRRREDEEKRIQRELANIREKFNISHTLSGKMKKKYLCKLIYIFLLGYDCSIGILEAINLITSKKYSEKYVGYLFLSVILNEKSRLSLLVHNAVKNDLTSSNHIHQNLALKYVANNANASLTRDISSDVLKILLNIDTSDEIKQSAILCLLRILRVNPEAIVIDNYIQRIAYYISSSNLGIVTTVCSLLEPLAEKGKLDGFPCVSNIVSKLHRLFRASPNDLKDYVYHEVHSPWMVIKLMRLLRKLPVPSESVVRSRYLDCIELIINKCQEPPKSKTLGHKNSKKAILYETIALIHHIKTDNPMIFRVCNILDDELRWDNNSCFLSLDTMCLLSDNDQAKMYFQQKLFSVKIFFLPEKDSSIREKASDLLFLLCDDRNIIGIVNDLFCYVEMCDTTSSKKEAILKIAYLAEQFYKNPTWYVDTILTLLENYGEYIRPEIWFRFVEIVKKTDEIHSYACKQIFDIIKDSSYSKNLVMVAGYILGEFGNLIAGDPNTNSRAQLECLQKKFSASSVETKALLLTTYIKFINLFPDLKEDVRKVFCEHVKHSNVEIQQRAVEYLKLSECSGLESILEVMPFGEKKESTVLKALQKMRPGFYQKAVAVREEHIQSKPKLSKANAVRFDSVKSAIEELTENKPQVGILVNIFNETETGVSSSVDSVPCCESSDPLLCFIWQNNGVVFENDTLLVSYDCEFNRNLGRILLSYQNKSVQPFQNFSPSFVGQNNLNLKFYLKPCASMLCAGEDTTQEIDVECLQEFYEMPALTVGFEITGTVCKIDFRLPVTLNKFFEPISMLKDEFLCRWSYLTGKELVRVFDAKLQMDSNMLVSKLIGMKMSVLPNLSLDPADLYGAGIFHCSAYPIGVLYRLQSNKYFKQYRLTIRASRVTVLPEIAKLVETLV